tara:strand:- start:190 stop:1230 length:1041 start_codon:yes stop_codon:yes gene_type:complete
MTFKLRSGNKTAFKMMGSSSPMKETGDGLDTPNADRINQNTRISKEQKLNEEIDYQKKKRELEQAAIETTPWNENVKAETATLKGQKGPTKGEDGKTSGKDAITKTDVGEGGYDYGEDGELGDGTRFDANINKYKTASQIKEDNKQRKLKSELYDSDGGKKTTKAEKYANKTQKLADKYQRAKGEGSFGLKFDWKNMLMGDGIMKGFSIERKQDIIADKLSKRSQNRQKYLDKQEGKKNRGNIKIESYQNEKKEIDSYISDLETQRDKITDVNSKEYKNLQKQIDKNKKKSTKLENKSEKTRDKRDNVKNKYKIQGYTNVRGENVRKDKKGNVDKNYDKRKYKKDQ